MQNNDSYTKLYTCDKATVRKATDKWTDHGSEEIKRQTQERRGVAEITI